MPGPTHPPENPKLASVQHCALLRKRITIFYQRSNKKKRFLSPSSHILAFHSQLLLLSQLVFLLLLLSQPPTPISLTSPLRFLSLITFNSTHSFLSECRGAVSTGAKFQSVCLFSCTVKFVCVCHRVCETGVGQHRRGRKGSKRVNCDSDGEPFCVCMCVCLQTCL